MSQAATLYQLQTLDSEIDSIRQRLAEIGQLLEQNEAVRAAQTALERSEEEHRRWQTRLTDLELERAHLKEETAAAEKRLYSGKITNPRELADLQGKVRELNQRYEDLEEPLIEAMLYVEESSQAMAEAEAALERVRAEQASATTALSDEQARLSDRLKELEAQVEQIRAQIEAEHLARYDKLRQRLKGGIAVVAVRNNGCGVCGVQLTSRLVQQIRHGQVLTCPTCGRILYIP